jgi:2-methylcitrate dehydratase
MKPDTITLPRNTNQALALGRFAHEFLSGQHGAPGEAALACVERFHLDSVACGVSALALGTNAPNVLRREALEYQVDANARGATCFGSRTRVHVEKAIAANCSAVREWDSNGTNFGFNPALGHTAGEFGHNDFYPVVIAAAQVREIDGDRAALAMLLLDEIRGRLAEVFSLKSFKIDHVVHGAIASAVVYGALVGATAEQIESAIGLLVAHYIPFRAIRAGKQLSDSKGASAALSTEMAITSVHRAMRGFVGPADIFRNPEAIFCLFEKPAKKGGSPFDLTLSVGGADFAVCGMHFKLGLYEHQSAGAIQGLIDLLARHPEVLQNEMRIKKLRISIYEPAFGIIGDPAKRDPRTRQSADHSMVYIVATLLRKALERRTSGWRALMLMPEDYDDAAIIHPLTRQLMERIEFVHGGPEYDAKYPDGIPTTLEIEHADLGTLSSGLVMYPAGHARYPGSDLDALLAHKFQLLAGLGVRDPGALYEHCHRLRGKSADEMASLYAFDIQGLD